jgi:hypothetical protein
LRRTIPGFATRVETTQASAEQQVVFVAAFRSRVHPVTSVFGRPNGRLAGVVNGETTLGTALAVSGSAANSNRGYHLSPSVSALLTVFNARLGSWLGNPKQATWQESAPRSRWLSGLLYLIQQAINPTDDRSDFIYISDGGHFESLGVYELIRRRCRFIVVCDAGADPGFKLEGLGTLMRKARTDFGVNIEIDVSALCAAGDRRARGHVAVGRIRYGNVDRHPGATYDDADPKYGYKLDEGLLVYIKPTLTGDEPTDLENYAADNPAFPHDTTLNQFFKESQFESYRALGYHCADSAFDPVVRSLQPDWGRFSEANRTLFHRLYDNWYPPPPEFSQAFVEADTKYIAVHAALRTEPLLAQLSAELCAMQNAMRAIPALTNGDRSELERRAAAARSAVALATGAAVRQVDVERAERHAIAQMLTVLEQVYFGLQLNRYHRHPVHNGWIGVFQRWWLMPTVARHWASLQREFSREFREFLEIKLPHLSSGD